MHTLPGCVSFQGGGGICCGLYCGRKWFMSFRFPSISFMCASTTHNNNEHSSNPAHRSLFLCCRNPPPEKTDFTSDLTFFLTCSRSLRITYIDFLFQILESNLYLTLTGHSVPSCVGCVFVVNACGSRPLTWSWPI